MSVVRIVTRILPSGSKRDDHLLEANDVGVPLSKEWSHSGSAFVAETTFCKENVLPPHADIDAASACPSISGLVCLKKSRLRLSSEEQPLQTRRRSSLVRVCPEMLEDGTCGGILLSIPLRISRSDLTPPDRLQKKFLCEVCGKGFNNKGFFTKHCARHSRQRACGHPLEKFLRDDKCLLCDFVFASPTEADIKRHLVIHMSVTQLEWLDELLSAHRKNSRSKSAPRLKAYDCPCCEATIEGCVALKKHIQNEHPGQLPYHCDQCPERFRSLGAFQKHATLHEDRKRFLCDVCGKGFNTHSVFVQHCLLHKGDSAAFRCRKCRKVFSSKASFVLHKRSHTRKHLCPSCGMRFKFPQHLKNHVATFHQTSEMQPSPS